MRLSNNESKTQPLKLVYKSEITSEEKILRVVHNKIAYNSMKIIN